MTTITAKIIADSISPENIRLTTFQLKYPYIIHGELMTHRVFSRNASSTRAIPVKELIRRIEEDPFIPRHWGAAQKGMQADKECDALIQWGAGDSLYSVTNEGAWRLAMTEALRWAERFDHAGYHKQVANRLLMPFMHMDTVCTATDWNNFFHLRIHPDAEPHIQMLAKTMKQQLDLAKPVKMQPGDWHLPYIKEEDVLYVQLEGHKYTKDDNWLELLTKMSVARCAWVSYSDPLGKKASLEQEVALHDKLVVSQPLHATPAEHQATPDTRSAVYNKGAVWKWSNPQEHGNFRGWRQYRKMLPGECVDG